MLIGEINNFAKHPKNNGVDAILSMLCITKDDVVYSNFLIVVDMIHINAG